MDNTSNEPSKFRTRNWIETNDHSREAYSHNSQIKLEASIPKSSLCDYSDAYIHAKRTITVPNTGGNAAVNITNKKVILKNCPPFTNCIREINNTQVDDARDIDLVDLVILQ